jgi:ABC-type cobalamin transport system permease subunit
MGVTAARFFSLLFAALALAPALAHLLELPNKIGLSRDDYLVVQQIYRGWALLGIVVLSALLSTLILTILVRKRPNEFALSLVAFLCIVGTQVVFWTFTFPTNQQTSNWTVLPEHWTTLRMQWEYSHAASAVLNLIAFIALALSVSRDNRYL